ncbi:DUF1957 domain-containing protein [Candidatus Dependentiae bacterium]|nr:DUF1957 domain-containing protein [Candidatus Dependentiae bacterium]
MKKHFTFVLHSHLPYVLSHGKWPHGTDWLNEALSETYIPLLNAFKKLVSEGISPNVTIGITPVLCEQLADEDFFGEFNEYLDVKIKVAQENKKDFLELNETHFVGLAEFWENFYSSIKKDFNDKYKKDILGEFKKLQDAGHLEIITCGATHGYLPLLSEDTSVNAQIKAAIYSYERFFGCKPRGIWLPEAAYRPAYEWSPPAEHPSKDWPRLRKGVEEILFNNGIKYFFVDSHLLKGGEHVGVYIDRFKILKELWKQFEDGYKIEPEDTEKIPYLPYLVSSTGGMKSVSIFTRDKETALQVWSGEYGYPGDGNYLDFHKKHYPGGLKYWRVTSPKADLADKEDYNVEYANNRIPEQASHYADLINDVLEKNCKDLPEDKNVIITAPFDTELFGHWWFEGTSWIYHVIKKIHEQGKVTLKSAGDFLEENPPTRIVSIPEGSWGQGGFHYIWINKWTKWTWKHVYKAEYLMKELVKDKKWKDDSQLLDLIRQLGRELLLLQSSDWQFLISTWSARDYAEVRITRHSEDFMKLHSIIEQYKKKGKITEAQQKFFEMISIRDRLFPEVDPGWWLEEELGE